MNLTAIITGDMVASRTLSPSERDKFIFIISNLNNSLDTDACISAEIFRGDSFQLKIENPLYALKYAIMIRGIFRSQNYPGCKKQWDCRLAIGIGHTEFEKSSPGLSDGEAYRLSGYGLDDMKRERLIISTPWRDINEEMTVTTAFADDIISGWTVKQSEVVLSKLRSNFSNTEIAARQQVSRQAIDKLINSSKFSLIELYLNRFKQILTPKL